MPHCQNCGYYKDRSEGHSSESMTFYCNPCFDEHAPLECYDCCCWAKHEEGHDIDGVFVCDDCKRERK